MFKLVRQITRSNTRNSYLHLSGSVTQGQFKIQNTLPIPCIATFQPVAHPKLLTILLLCAMQISKVQFAASRSVIYKTVKAVKPPIGYRLNFICYSYQSALTWDDLSKKTTYNTSWNSMGYFQSMSFNTCIIRHLIVSKLLQ